MYTSSAQISPVDWRRMTISYWRRCLDDGDWESRVPQEGKFVTPSVIGKETFLRGILSEEIAGNFFANKIEDEDSKVVSLLVAPYYLTRLERHLSSNKHLPPTLTPIWLRAYLSEDGQLSYPGNRPLSEALWLRRSYLSPSQHLINFGEVETLELALDDMERQLVGMNEVLWQFFAGSCFRLMELFGDWKQKISNWGYHYEQDELLVIADTATNRSQISRNLRWVYDYLLVEDIRCQALENYIACEEQLSNVLSNTDAIETFSDHTAHPDGGKSLSTSQRTALAGMLKLEDGQILAVNGPPGTGKTTLLSDFILSAWVNSAIKGQRPPITVVSSSNNQAITNVLETLDSAVKDIRRWLPDPVSGMGMYLVNNLKRQKWASENSVSWMNSQLIAGGLPAIIEQEAWIEHAESYFLQNAGGFFDRKFSGVAEIIATLEGQIEQRSEQLEQISLLLSCLAIRQNTPGYESKLKRRLDKAEMFLKLSSRRLEQIEKALAEMFAISDSDKELVVSIEQRLLAQHSSELLSKFLSEDNTSPREFLLASYKGLKKRRKKHTSAKSQIIAKLKKFAQLDVELEVISRKFEISIEEIQAASDWTTHSSLVNHLDTSIRKELFELALHYWEARWLIEAKKEVQKRGDSHPNQHPQAKKRLWQLRAMLTPCFVVTMHSGPAFFDCFDLRRQPHFNVIDNLIIDEAGQIAPEVSGAMISLAKKVISVGDLKQIPPVRQLPDELDRVNFNFHFSSISAEREQLEDFRQDSGLSASLGSVLSKSQQNTSFATSDKPDVPAGFFLREHYRSRPDIISFCNELAYNNQISPQRPEPEHSLFPAFAYAHVEGFSKRSSGGSLENVREATAIVTWLMDNQSKLIEHYQKISGGRITELKQIVGLITPFAAQASLLGRKLKQVDLDIEKHGTTHRLQGAEKPIIIFSSVYSTQQKLPSRLFFDRGETNLLNVAVSRACDSFVVFGDMGLFDESLSYRPSGLLAKYLFSRAENKLQVVALPPEASAVDDCDVRLLKSRRDYIAALKMELGKAQKRVIVSLPQLKEISMFRLQLQEAVSREVAVRVYVSIAEAQQNQSLVNSLANCGIDVAVVSSQVASVIAIDSRTVIEGERESFVSLDSEEQGDKNGESSASDSQDNSKQLNLSYYRGSKMSGYLETVLQKLETRVQYRLRD